MLNMSSEIFRISLEILSYVWIYFDNRSIHKIKIPQLRLGKSSQGHYFLVLGINVSLVTGSLIV